MRVRHLMHSKPKGRKPIPFLGGDRGRLDYSRGLFIACLVFSGAVSAGVLFNGGLSWASAFLFCLVFIWSIPACYMLAGCIAMIFEWCPKGNRTKYGIALLSLHLVVGCVAATILTMQDGFEISYLLAIPLAIPTLCLFSVAGTMLAYFFYFACVFLHIFLGWLLPQMKDFAERFEPPSITSWKSAYFYAVLVIVIPISFLILTGLAYYALSKALGTPW